MRIASNLWLIVGRTTDEILGMKELITDKDMVLSINHILSRREIITMSCFLASSSDSRLLVVLCHF